jgi:hypothetical protein
MNFTTTLEKEALILRQIVNYRNGYSMTIVGFDQDLPDKPQKSISDFHEFEVFVTDHNGKPVCDRNANVPEWLEPVFAELAESLGGYVFRSINKETVKWLHEELEERAGLPLINRIAHWLNDYYMRRSYD